MNFKDLTKKILKYNPKADITQINKAYKFAKEIIKDIKRDSGESKLNHNLAVTFNLASIKADDISLIAGLLHNLLDVDPDLESKIKEQFGEKVLKIVKQTKKSNNLGIANLKEPEKIRKLLVFISKDPRTILVKICNKIDTLRTVEFLKDKRRAKRICEESLSIYAPLAQKLGMYLLKTKLEDYAFKRLEPETYKEILIKLNESEIDRLKRMKIAEKYIEGKLKKLNLKAKIKSRTKNIYSIHKKVVDRGYTVERMYDTVALRVILEKSRDCYLLLGVIQENATPIPGTFKDYISSPKPNGYQSIHISILDSFSKPIEIQIRTKEMDYIAEEGVASHSLYKGHSFQGAFEDGLNRIKKKISLQDYEEDPELFKEQILVKTPKGDLIELSQGATVLDLAYKLHTNLGGTAVGAYINNKPSRLQETLHNGDLVEIISRKNSKPGSNFLKIAKTKYAKEKIRVSLRKQGKLINH